MEDDRTAQLSEKKASPGRPVTPVMWIIEPYFLQICFFFSDSQSEKPMHDSYAVQKFLRLHLGRDCPPDGATILRFRRLIERHGRGFRVLEVLNRHLSCHGVRIQANTIVDRLLIHAPSSKKNGTQSRDPEMASSKRRNQRHFGAKLHLVVDSRTKVIHAVATTPANVHDGQVEDKLLHGQERRVCGD